MALSYMKSQLPHQRLIMLFIGQVKYICMKSAGLLRSTVHFLALIKMSHIETFSDASCWNQWLAPGPWWYWRQTKTNARITGLYCGSAWCQVDLGAPMWCSWGGRSRSGRLQFWQPSVLWSLHFLGYSSDKISRMLQIVSWKIIQCNRIAHRADMFPLTTAITEAWSENSKFHKKHNIDNNDWNLW